MGLFDKLFKRTPRPGEPLEINDESFEQMVLASETPAVVDFYSNRCSPCHVMSGLLSEVGPDYDGRVKVFKLNVDNNPQSATQYQVMSVPTLVFFKNHRPVDKVVGLIQMNPLRAKLDGLA